MTDFISGVDKIVLDQTIFNMLSSVINSGLNLCSQFATLNNIPALSKSLIKIYSSIVAIALIIINWSLMAQRL